MSKDRRVNSSSFDRAMVSPYSCSLKMSDGNNSDGTSPHVGDEREWEEARCPICMEHPHNAVLLLCSSCEKGCRPFICDTSYRHSNCLDQFRKSSAVASSLQTPFEKQQCELVCPLCRGLVTGWDVINPARKFMNSKTRSCSLETCSFNGNYAELRKHARLEHPSRRPSVASPNRQLNWVTLERQREIEDALAHQSDVEYDFDGWSSFDGWPSFEEWSGFDEMIEDAWSDGSFFDFSSGMSDIENETIDEMFSDLSLPLFSPCPSPQEAIIESGRLRSSNRPPLTISPPNPNLRSNNHLGHISLTSRSISNNHDEEGAAFSRSRLDYRREMDLVNFNPAPSPQEATINSGSSRSSDGPPRTVLSTNPNLRSNNHLGHISHTSRSVSSNHNEEGAGFSRSSLGYSRESDLINLRSISSFHRENGATNLHSRSGYHREYAPTSLRTRSSYRRENDSTRSTSSSRRENASTNLSLRSGYHRENAPTSLHTRSNYPRENVLTASRSRSIYRRENSPSSSRARSSYHREDAWPSSRARSRFHPMEGSPPVRGRHLRGSSRLPHSIYERIEE